MKRSGVVLTFADAYAIHRILELHLADRKFFNPLEAWEAKAAACRAMAALGEKLMAQRARETGGEQ